MKLKSICKFLLGSAVVIVVIVLALVISFIVYCYNAKDNVVSDSIEVRQDVNDSIMLQVDSEQELDSTNIQEPQVESEQEKLARKFLITNNSAGLFTLNDTIGNLAKWYGWDTSASIFYFDGCIRPSLNLSGGIDLFHKYVDYIEVDTYPNMDTTKYFYNKSDNCEGYFCKDTIQWIWIFSNEFKTSEGIGVGSSFKEIQKSFPELYANYRISVDGMNDIYVTSKKYPNVEFHFTDEAMTIDIEKEENESDGLVPEDGSHFYADSAVYMIRIYSQME